MRTGTSIERWTVTSFVAALLLASCNDDVKTDPAISISPFSYPETACLTDADCTLAMVVRDCEMCCTFGVRSVRDTDRVRADYTRVRETCNSKANADAGGTGGAGEASGFSVCAAICSFTSACRDGQCTTVACPQGGRCSDAGP